MYKIYHNGSLLCDSKIEELALIDPVISLEENKAGSFTFSIPYTHPNYEDIARRSSVISVYRDDEESPVFCGPVIEVSTDFYNTKEIYCEGELTYLNDSIQRQARYQDISVRDYIAALLEAHNSQVEEGKQFTLGAVTVTDPNDSLYRYTNMNSTMEELKEDIIDDLGGIVRIRYEDGARILDVLAESPYTCNQTITLGENLTDFTSNLDSTDIATAIIPLGAKQDEEEIEGLKKRLDITSVNGGVDYVYSEDAVETYGWITKVVEWDDVTTASALLTKGQQYLADIQFENLTIEAKAIDLHAIDSNLDHFNISDEILVVSKPHGLNKWFRLTEQTINLNAPQDDTVTLGKTEQTTLTSSVQNASDTILKKIESLPTTQSVLNSAVANATALITSAMGGYVYKTQNELYIMDTDDPETAQKVWRWNLNGLGYSSTGIDGEYGLAMTMDGAIVADYITTGTLSCDRLNGGTIEGQSISGGTIEGAVITNTTSTTNLTIKNAELRGGYTDEAENYIDFSNRVDKVSTLCVAGENGVRISAPNFYIDTGDGTTCYACTSGTMNVITSISVSGSTINWITTSYVFCNGLLVSSL